MGVRIAGAIPEGGAAAGGDYERNETLNIHGLQLPAWIHCAIITSELRETNAGDGEYVSVGFKCKSNHQGERAYAFWQNFTWENKSERAQVMGRVQLAELYAACGLPEEADSDELVGLECDVQVVLKLGNKRPDGGTYPDELRGRAWREAGSHSADGGGVVPNKGNGLTQEEKEEAARLAGSPFYPEKRSETPAPTAAQMNTMQRGQQHRPDPTVDLDDDIPF